MMDLNQITADLHFDNSRLISVNVNCAKSDIDDSASVTFGLDVKYSTPRIVDDRKVGKLRMVVLATVQSEKDDTKPDSFAISMEGTFSSVPSIEDPQFLELLNINGASALYSIARSKIEVLSGMAYERGKIIIPMINMIKYYEENSKSE